jgi:hypothetical protein
LAPALQNDSLRLTKESAAWKRTALLFCRMVDLRLKNESLSEFFADDIMNACFQSGARYTLLPEPCNLYS